MSVEPPPPPVTAPTPCPFQTRHDEDIDWANPQNARIVFSLRLANAFFANEWCSDMAFYVPADDHHVPAHSLIVAAASPFLQRCCIGTGTIGGDIIVAVPDYCTTEVLLIVLRYLYAGGYAQGINDANVGLVLKVADAYELCKLQHQCETKIRHMLSDSNVCTIFNHIHNISTTELVGKCMDYMQTNTAAILANGSAMEMEDVALKKLLAADSPLRVTEMELVASMIKWADEQCVRRSMEHTPANRRRILGQRLGMINFGSLDLHAFMDCVEMFGDGCFTADEIWLTIQQIRRRLGNSKHNDDDDDKSDYPFSSKQRYVREIETTGYKKFFFKL